MTKTHSILMSTHYFSSQQSSLNSTSLLLLLFIFVSEVKSLSNIPKAFICKNLTSFHTHQLLYHTFRLLTSQFSAQFQSYHFRTCFISKLYSHFGSNFLFHLNVQLFQYFSNLILDGFKSFLYHYCFVMTQVS